MEQRRAKIVAKSRNLNSHDIMDRLGYRYMNKSDSDSDSSSSSSESDSGFAGTKPKQLTGAASSFTMDFDSSSSDDEKKKAGEKLPKKRTTSRKLDPKRRTDVIRT